MDFSDALDAVKHGGEKIARERWMEDGRYVVLSPGFQLPADQVFSEQIQDHIGDGLGNFKPYLMKHTSDDSFVPWVATQSDLLADDWYVVEN